MNFFKLVNRFWLLSIEKSFSPTEVGLYFYLLYEANRNMWNMPFRCPSIRIRTAMNTTRQSFEKARNALQSRGLIEYVKGKNQKCFPVYTIVDESIQLPAQLPTQLPPIYIKEKENKYSLEEIKLTLSNDVKWQKDVVSALNNETIRSPDDLLPILDRFFMELLAKGIEERGGDNLKNYFFNWTKQQLNKKNYGKSRSENNRFRVVESGSGEKNYEGAF